MAKEFKMSQARYDELKQELDYSKTTRADEVAELRTANMTRRKTSRASSTPALPSWRTSCSMP